MIHVIILCLSFISAGKHLSQNRDRRHPLVCDASKILWYRASIVSSYPSRPTTTEYLGIRIFGKEVYESSLERIHPLINLIFGINYSPDDTRTTTRRDKRRRAENHYTCKQYFLYACTYVYARSNLNNIYK